MFIKKNWELKACEGVDIEEAKAAYMINGIDTWLKRYSTKMTADDEIEILLFKADGWFKFVVHRNNEFVASFYQEKRETGTFKVITTEKTEIYYIFNENDLVWKRCKKADFFRQ